MVEYKKLSEFYDNLLAELNVACFPVVSKKNEPISFEFVAAELIDAVEDNPMLNYGRVFPCIRQPLLDSLKNGKITSLQFIVLLGFSKEREEECNQLIIKIFGKDVVLSEEQIKPASGFEFSSIAYDVANTNDIWLGRILKCEAQESKKIYSLIAFSLEQLLMERQNSTDIWHTSVFSSIRFSNEPNYYFFDQYRKNVYFNEYNEGNYCMFMPTVLPRDIFFKG